MSICAQIPPIHKKPTDNFEHVHNYVWAFYEWELIRADAQRLGSALGGSHTAFSHAAWAHMDAPCLSPGQAQRMPSPLCNHPITLIGSC